ncbi:MAG: penicillin-binding protein 1C [Bacteroidia bacterium]|nr:penicillin-binding protein 1C [Bacteroidia bacterium]
MPFNKSTSTVLLSSTGELLGARIAEDGQWRFSASDSVPYRIEKCLLEFEDRNFYDHFGVSLKGIGRAIQQNIRNGRIVSGGSTITMQVARMMRERSDRTFKSKFIEMSMALRMELKYSKSEILMYYVSNAPFGNNVVGLEAASWRYYLRSPEKLSWAESATLAVLPNAPSLLYPGKNHDRLLAKRNRLLKRLKETNVIDSTTYALALMEQLPVRPLPLPSIASHLLDKLIKDGKKGQTIISTIDFDLQKKIESLTQTYMRILEDKKIFNASVLISSVKNGDVLAYLGNVQSSEPGQHATKVDCIQAKRSTGSVLKPILFAKSLEEGLITPQSILYDVPTYFGGFSPKNFNYRYDGIVPANDALCKSLNVPFVRLLEDYGYEKFHFELRNMGLHSLDKPASYYGLAMILGGAEAKSWELNEIYSRMGRELLNKKTFGIHYDKRDTQIFSAQHFNRACLYSTFNIMTELGRPDEEGNWRLFDNKKKVAWKTGTSFGFRDAWAIGVTADFVVSIWVGNADGEGRPGLTGIKAAAPLLFDVFRILPDKSPWFKEPISDMRVVDVCRESGYRAGPNCPNKFSAHLPYTCLEKVSCVFHKTIFLDASKKYRVDCDCESPFKMQQQSWFILAPGIEKYYKQSHPDYISLPPFKNNCGLQNKDKPLTILYPRQGSRIAIPIEIDGGKGSALFELAHRTNGIRIYWHLDNEFIGETKDIHQMKFNPNIGKHKLLCMDENGNSQLVEFEVLGSQKKESEEY